MSIVVVVFPFVPVTAICSARQNAEASSSSLTTCLPPSFASSTWGFPLATPGLTTTMSQSLNTDVHDVEWLFVGLSS